MPSGFAGYTGGSAKLHRWVVVTRTAKTGTDGYAHSHVLLHPDWLKIRNSNLPENYKVGKKCAEGLDSRTVCMKRGILDVAFHGPLERPIMHQTSFACVAAWAKPKSDLKC
ncbi:hypothetical protein HS088_TW11G00866 [Tripterygium wilfordii]|uniref:Uncharacterized protein n=1 Tax=Tripterygium wilfordii TaxID=458696 RepID=A0A7J7D369_TRIWF|nr:hypothetical protein HS088_TW11G00866 [Tripterygium wilfordii]